MIFNNEFRDRLFNWVRSNKPTRHVDINIIYRLMKLYGQDDDAERIRREGIPTLPPVDKEDAELLENCFRVLHDYDPRSWKLIRAVWVKNLRPRLIKERLGIFRSQQAIELAIAERSFEALVRKTEEFLIYPF